MTDSGKVSQKIRFEVQKHLEEVLIAKEGGLFQYKSGHSDETVADRFGVSKGVVQGTRGKTFGNLKIQSAQRGTEQKKRLEGIDNKIAMLEAQLSEAEEKIQKINRRVLDLELAATEPANEQSTFSVMRSGA